MKRLICILLILAVMLPIVVQASYQPPRITAEAAHMVISKLPPALLLEDVVERKIYKCVLPWWIVWLCNALNAKSCPSCYTYMT